MESYKLTPLTTLPDVAKLVAHPLADEYPMADPHEFEGLKASIKQHGIREPITLIVDTDSSCKILDGRNRHRAAMECGHIWKLENLPGDLQSSGDVRLRY